MPASAPYGASKFAVTGFAECIYYDLAERGVSVTLISPGLVASEIRTVNNQGIATGKADPAPAWLVMPVEKAARQMVNALYRRKPVLIVTGHGKLVVWLQRHFPRLTRLIFRVATRGRMKRIEEAKRGKLEA
jgi:short-subunit dehydrogenase